MTRCFWRKLPADAAALSVGVNRKTVHRGYAKLRKILRKLNEAEWAGVMEEILTRGPSLSVGVGGDGKNILGDEVELMTLLAWRGKVLSCPPGVFQGSGDQLRAQLGPGLTLYTRGGERSSNQGVGEIFGRIEGVMETHLDRVKVALCRQFLGYLVGQLKDYRGGYKSNVGLYVHELLFRFNNRHGVDPERVVKELMALDSEGETESMQQNKEEEQR